MARIVNDVSKWNESVLTRVTFEARNTPANPEVDAPIANASSLVVTVLMPMLAAASSSSRIAIQDRPSRESWRRYTPIMTSARITAMVP
jgi:hypothetical protein